jgi:hypothetical protein
MIRRFNTVLTEFEFSTRTWFVKVSGRRVRPANGIGNRAVGVRRLTEGYLGRLMPRVAWPIDVPIIGMC